MNRGPPVPYNQTSDPDNNHWSAITPYPLDSRHSDTQHSVGITDTVTHNTPLE